MKLGENITFCRQKQVPVNKNQNNTVLRVADNYLQWSEGEIFVFDDSFDHEVWHSNENNEARIVLIMDLWHPQLSAEKRASLPAIQNMVNRWRQLL